MAPIVFDAAFDPVEAFSHKKSWSTDVITSEKTSEQAVALRSIPVDVVSFSVSGIEPDQMQHIDGLLQAGTPDGYWVPMWRDRIRLTAQLNSGATSVPFSTSLYSTFERAEAALLWRSPYLWEKVDYDEGVLSATVSNWAAGTLFMPLIKGYIVDVVSPSRLSRDAVSVPVSFLLTIRPGEV